MGSAFSRQKKQKTSDDAGFEDAKDKVLMGAEKIYGDESKERATAYHEAGHALVGVFTPGNDPLHKVTIIPRGRAFGVTMNLQKEIDIQNKQK